MKMINRGLLKCISSWRFLTTLSTLLDVNIIFFYSSYVARKAFFFWIMFMYKQADDGIQATLNTQTLHYSTRYDLQTRKATKRTIWTSSSATQNTYYNLKLVLFRTDYCSITWFSIEPIIDNNEPPGTVTRYTGFHRLLISLITKKQ